MPLNKSQIAKRFGKGVLLSIAERDLDLRLAQSTHVYVVIDKIIADLDTNGIPEEELSDDLFDLLIAIDYMDEDGNVLDEEAEEVLSEEGGNDEEPLPLPDKIPECWGWGDLEDPACKKCPFSEACIRKRDKNTSEMPCFGTVYDEANEDCKRCLMWKFCKRSYEEQQGE